MERHSRAAQADRAESRKGLDAQEKALQAHEKQLALAQAELERSKQSINESIELQRVAVARQAQVRNIALPLIVVVLPAGLLNGEVPHVLASLAPVHDFSLASIGAARPVTLDVRHTQPAPNATCSPL
jgi:hypothetical protein